MSLAERLIADPNVCHGELCVRGTRVMVAVILDNLYAGEAPTDIATGYGSELEDVWTVIEYRALRI